jgi:DNA polymerase IV (DinB-like DNA polymerase)
MRIIVHVDMGRVLCGDRRALQPGAAWTSVGSRCRSQGWTRKRCGHDRQSQARKFGIRSALPISRAWRLAQAARRRGEAETIFLHANFQLYETAFSRIMQIFEWFSDSVEEASIDEAYLDGSLLKSFNDAQDRMTALKKEILREERIGCSIGIAPNKLIAKIPPVEISRMA